MEFINNNLINYKRILLFEKIPSNKTIQIKNLNLTTKEI